MTVGLALALQIVGSIVENALIRQDELARVRSPSGSKEARYVVRHGGAATGFFSSIRLRRRWTPYMLERGVIAIDGKPDIELLWRSDAELLVRWTRCANDPRTPRIEWQEPKWGDVVVSMEEGPPISAAAPKCVERADYLRREKEFREDLAEYEARYGRTSPRK
jgi:hypothetical protein